MVQIRIQFVHQGLTRLVQRHRGDLLEHHAPLVAELLQFPLAFHQFALMLLNLLQAAVDGVLFLFQHGELALEIGFPLADPVFHGKHVLALVRRLYLELLAGTKDRVLGLDRRVAKHHFGFPVRVSDDFLCTGFCGGGANPGQDDPGQVSR